MIIINLSNKPAGMIIKLNRLFKHIINRLISRLMSAWLNNPFNHTLHPLTPAILYR